MSDLAGAILYDGGFGHTVIDRSEIVELLRFLEDCKEEGRALYPEILVTTDFSSCFAGIHPLQLIICGECADRPGRIRRALKKCAALATEPWVVVLEVSRSCVRYGLATANVRADSASLCDEVLQARTDNQDPPFLFLRRYGTRAIWLKTPKTDQVISLTLSDELLKATEHIGSFAKLVTDALRDGVREKTERLVARLIQEACREGHGFIAAVAGSNDLNACKAELPDGSWLSPNIDLSAPTDSTDPAAMLESESMLRARASLARRMIEMDLMTIFSTNGELVAYNVHIPSARATGATGGARTRAYEALKTIKGIRAAFMCSQDGQTRFHPFSLNAKA